MTLCLWEQREEQKKQGRQKPGFLHQRSSLNIHVFLLLTLHPLQAAVQTNVGYGQILNPFSKDGEQRRNVRKEAACFQRQLSKRQQMGSPAQARPGPPTGRGIYSLWAAGGLPVSDLGLWAALWDVQAVWAKLLHVPTPLSLSLQPLPCPQDHIYTGIPLYLLQEDLHAQYSCRMPDNFAHSHCWIHLTFLSPFWFKVFLVYSGVFDSFIS